MEDHALIEGVVVGEIGVPVAGYAQLGATGTRRPIATTLRVRTDDGHEVELVLVTTATFDPVSTVTGDWRDIERAPGAGLCVDEAPAPDVEVELTSCLVRGGDRIAAAGVVREHAFADEAGGGAYREGARRRVRVLAPSLVFLGEDAVERLEKLRATPGFPQLRLPSAVDHRVAKAVPRAKGPYRERVQVNLGTWFVIPAAMLLSVGMSVAGGAFLACYLVLLGAVMASPLVVDALVLPSYHPVPAPLTDDADQSVLHVLAHQSPLLFLLVLVIGSGSVAALLIESRGLGALRHPLDKIALALAPALLLAGSVAARRTAARIRMTARVASAPAHAQPIVDGIWGALDGQASAAGTVTVTLDDQPQLVYQGTHHGHGLSHGGRRIATAVPAILVEHRGTRTPVSLQGALWFSTTRYVRSASPEHYVADVIRVGANVRVVGRMKNGEIAKGGEGSLVIFATEPGASVKRVLRSCRQRDLTALIMAGGGGALVLAGAVLALVRRYG